MNLINWGVVEDIRERHIAGVRQPAVGKDGEPFFQAACAYCRLPFPCDAARACEALDELRTRLVRVQARCEHLNGLVVAAQRSVKSLFDEVQGR